VRHIYHFYLLYWSILIRSYYGGGKLDMKFEQSQKKLIINTVTLLFLLAGGNVLAATTVSATACFQSVQGKIAWDYKGNKRWSPSDINRLCRGAERSREPAACFNRVMHGRVNYGGGTKWQWKNALNLCKGSKNANATISCFKSRVQRGGWQPAIKTCSQKVTTLPPRRSPLSPTTGSSSSTKIVQVMARKLAFQIPKDMQKRLLTIQWTMKGKDGDGAKGREIHNMRFYQVVNLVNGRGIKMKKRIRRGDPNLGFLGSKSKKYQVRVAEKKRKGAVRYGDIIALRVSGYGWLKYQKRKRGLSLKANKVKKPNSGNFIWQIRGGKKGVKLLTGMPFALYMLHEKSEIIFCQRTRGIDLGWYKKTKCGSFMSKVSGKVFGANGLLAGDGYSGKAFKAAKNYVCEAAVGAASTYVVAQTGGTGATAVAVAAPLAIKECNKL